MERRVLSIPVVPRITRVQKVATLSVGYHGLALLWGYQGNRCSRGIQGTKALQALQVLKLPIIRGTYGASFRPSSIPWCWSVAQSYHCRSERRQ